MSIYNYTPDFFNSIENVIKVDNIDIDKKIKNLIKNYSCFKSFKVYNKLYKKNKFQSYQSRIVDKTDDKVILSYLNKITNDNYDTLHTKIKNNMREDNYKIIIDKLLFISIKQSNYSKLYIDLFKSIIFDEVKCNYLNNKIEDILKNKNDDFKLLFDKISSDTYDEFCDNNKEKKCLKGKITIIINLIKFDIIALRKDFLMVELMKFTNYENELFLEILQIINNVSGLDKKIINGLQFYLDNNIFKGRMMIKFKIQDIITNKKIKDF